MNTILAILTATSARIVPQRRGARPWKLSSSPSPGPSKQSGRLCRTADSLQVKDMLMPAGDMPVDEVDSRKPVARRAVRDPLTRAAIATLHSEVDGDAVTVAWGAALQPPVRLPTGERPLASPIQMPSRAPDGRCREMATACARNAPGASRGVWIRPALKG